MRMFTISMGLSVKQWPYSCSWSAWKACQTSSSPASSNSSAGTRPGARSLADIAQIAGAPLLHAVGAEPGGLVLSQEVTAQPRKITVDPLDIHRSLDLEGGHDLVVLEVVVSRPAADVMPG